MQEPPCSALALKLKSARRVSILAMTCRAGAARWLQRTQRHVPAAAIGPSAPAAHLRVLHSDGPDEAQRLPHVLGAAATQATRDTRARRTAAAKTCAATNDAPASHWP